MNWYKTAQLSIQEQYQQLATKNQGPVLVGSGLNETISIPGSGKTITARELLERTKSRIMPILLQNHITEIDTSPIGISNAQGLAKSNSPGKIFVDVKKIFQNAKVALPPTVESDGISIDPDEINAMADKIGSWIEAELLDTFSHETFHMNNFRELSQQNLPFFNAQENPAEQFGQQIRKQYFPKTFNM